MTSLMSQLSQYASDHRDTASQLDLRKELQSEIESVVGPTLK